ncbi:hypothetical protein A3860_23830 [Niastella vici]|uniref:TIR domain-containing protein n=1 Tax=Niastella vici TaxID=1703345 RepID=A0A1V9FYC2_9BACT|nr:toll/interleukin-1 receptor domain-containing protein [Niastella vici]OQP63381.1 hypothetical protein A3860_23830 [Niastella vici]
MTVFLSYSTKDYFFAELMEIKLKEAGIDLWRDQGSLVAGADWRQGIEDGISTSGAVLIALSSYSTESPYVTYEWAYAIGKGKTIIPIKISQCQMHPRLESIQYLDFTVPNSLPWNLLTEQIKEIYEEIDPSSIVSTNATPNMPSNTEDPQVKAILNYLNQRGYQTASFERIRRRIDPNLTDEILDTLIENNKSIFRHVTLKDDKKGLAKIVP